MPNWCNNALKVSGKAVEVRRFAKAFIGLPARYKGETMTTVPKECFNALYPVPQDVLERGYNAHVELNPIERMECIYGDKEPPIPLDGYHWQIKYWGTKWDVYDDVTYDKSQLENTRDTDQVHITYYFDTAWSPPANWLKKVAKDFPDLEFTLLYAEPGCNFAGKLKIQGENVQTDICTNITNAIQNNDEELAEYANAYIFNFEE